MVSEQKLMLELVAWKVCGRALSENISEELSEERLDLLHYLSKGHGIAHIVGASLFENGLLTEEKNGVFWNKFLNSQLAAVNSYERSNLELSEIGKAFSQAEIKYIPLKGSVIREYYPEPWLRNSCDTDILVKEAELDMAVNCLTEKLGYSYMGKSSHDVSLFSPGGHHIELHYRLSEPDTEKFSLLESVWNYAFPDTEGSLFYRLPDEIFYYYHIAHMAKHFLHGGCGVRPFLDQWIMNHKMEHDFNKRLSIISNGGLSSFEKASRSLSEVWFSGENESELDNAISMYVLTGGVYGSLENSISIIRAKKLSRFGYAVSRIFLPYDSLKYSYPVLIKHKWLTPFCETVRWLRLIFSGGFKRSVKELKINKGLSYDKLDAAQKLLDILEL